MCFLLDLCLFVCYLQSEILLMFFHCDVVWITFFQLQPLCGIFKLTRLICRCFDARPHDLKTSNTISRALTQSVWFFSSTLASVSRHFSFFSTIAAFFELFPEKSDRLEINRTFKFEIERELRQLELRHSTQWAAVEYFMLLWTFDGRINV